MTNKERYQRAFSALHASDDHVMEVSAMKYAGKVRIGKLAVVCAVLVLVVAAASVAYASDVGGIQRSIQLWIYGDQTDAILEIQSGNYSLTYVDADGNACTWSGGGMASEDDGSVRPVTEEEILEHLSLPKVKYKEDGTVWVYHLDQKMEITDKFDSRGVCYVQVKDDGGVLYMTIKYHRGDSISRHSYPDPNSFN